jgi:hypothetical protein
VPTSVLPCCAYSCLLVPTRSYPCLSCRAYLCLPVPTRALSCLPVPTVPCYAYPCLPCLVMPTRAYRALSCRAYLCLSAPTRVVSCVSVPYRAIPCVFVPIRVVSSHVSCRILCHDVLCWDLLTVRVVSWHVLLGPLNRACRVMSKMKKISHATFKNTTRDMCRAGMDRHACHAVSLSCHFVSCCVLTRIHDFITLVALLWEFFFNDF